MRILLQRVHEASVTINRKIAGQIQKGILLFLGVTQTDTQAEAKFLAEKCLNLRIFEDAHGKLNHLTIQDIKGEILVISQFTLYGDCRKGRRPSFDKAAPPEQAVPLYEYFISQLQTSGLKIATGQFGAMMDVHLINDGPVTYVLEK